MKREKGLTVYHVDRTHKWHSNIDRQTQRGTFQFPSDRVSAQKTFVFKREQELIQSKKWSINNDSQRGSRCGGGVGYVILFHKYQAHTHSYFPHLQDGNTKMDFLWVFSIPMWKLNKWKQKFRHFKWHHIFWALTTMKALDCISV